MLMTSPIENPKDISVITSTREGRPTEISTKETMEVNAEAHATKWKIAGPHHNFHASLAVVRSFISRYKAFQLPEARKAHKARKAASKVERSRLENPTSMRALVVRGVDPSRLGSGAPVLDQW